MVLKCPKCGRTAPDDSIYCPYCAHGLKPFALTIRVSVGGILALIAAVASLVFLALSTRALLEIYSWYPQLVAQTWFIYDQMLAIFALTELFTSIPAAVLALSRKSYRWTMVLMTLCTLSGGGAWITSMIIPDPKLLNSVLYYFLPIFLTPLVGTVLIYPRKAEFKQ